jgi:hypothetical protein
MAVGAASNSAPQFRQCCGSGAKLATAASRDGKVIEAVMR